MAEALDRHYDAVAAHYQQAWFYEDGTDYQQWLARQLQVRSNVKVLDGGVRVNWGLGSVGLSVRRPSSSLLTAWGIEILFTNLQNAAP